MLTKIKINKLTIIPQKSVTSHHLILLKNTIIRSQPSVLINFIPLVLSNPIRTNLPCLT